MSRWLCRRHRGTGWSCSNTDTPFGQGRVKRWTPAVSNLPQICPCKPSEPSICQGANNRPMGWHEGPNRCVFSQKLIWAKWGVGQKTNSERGVRKHKKKNQQESVCLTTAISNATVMTDQCLHCKLVNKRFSQQVNYPEHALTVDNHDKNTSEHITSIRALKIQSEDRHKKPANGINQNWCAWRGSIGQSPQYLEQLMVKLRCTDHPQKDQIGDGSMIIIIIYGKWLALTLAS